MRNKNFYYYYNYYQSKNYKRLISYLYILYDFLKNNNNKKFKCKFSVLTFSFFFIIFPLNYNLNE